jgi:hypothetical protein
MEHVVARCPDCGIEQVEAFANCFVCMRPSQWWCRSCGTWLVARACPACGGGLAVPAELPLGTATIGAKVEFSVKARNNAKKLVGCTVACDDPGVTFNNPRILVPAGGSIAVRGAVAVLPGALGRRTFRLRFEAPVPSETVLVVDVAAPAPRIEFVPSPVLLSSPQPGSTIRTSVLLKNTGNVPLIPSLSCSEPWLLVEPRSVDLDPGESASVRLSAKSKRTDSGTREARLRASADGGMWEAVVGYALPNPQLAADPVAFGELRPGRPAFADVVLKNTGAVRVACTLAAADPWVQVRPTRVNLPPGRQKTVRVRAVIAAEHDGPQWSELVISSETGVVLRVPITAVGRVPKPVLRAIRKQRVRDAIGPPVERKFQVANDGDGRLTCTATADKLWVQIVTPALDVGPGKKRKLRYVLNLPVLPRGEHCAVITLATNAGTTEVPVTVHVLDPNPVLEVLPGPDLGAISPELPLSAFVQVRNAGIGLLTVRAESENPRVVVAPAEHNVPMGPPVRFNLTIPVAGLPGGEHEAAVRLTSNGGTGRAVVRFRLPVELIDAPALIDLGDRPAGRLTGDALRLKNIGPDRVTLRIRAEDQWLRPGTDRVTVNPGELVAVPFRVDLPTDVFGLVVGALVVEGRSVRHTVAVRAVARKVELIVVPSVLVLGDMAPGEERAFTVEVMNAGEIAVEVRETHVAGDLEVWIEKSTVSPGERVRLSGRARVNSRQINQQLRTQVPLDEAAALRCSARVVRSIVPRVAAVTAVTGGLIAGGAVSVALGWWLGVPLALAGLAVGAWLFWLDMR